MKKEQRIMDRINYLRQSKYRVLITSKVWKATASEKKSFIANCAHYRTGTVLSVPDPDTQRMDPH